MDRDELLKQIPMLIPEDANEALSSYEVNGFGIIAIQNFIEE